jgi:hypothetical protein
MARRPHLDYTAVREMPILDIARLWYRELGMSQDLLENELRLAVINLARNWREEGFIDPAPPVDDRPPVTTLMSREQIWEFCEKQKGWPLPTFWFPREREEVRQRGRPSHMGAILQELDRRAAVDQLEATMTEQARALNDWAVEQGHRRLSDKSVRDGISELDTRKNLAAFVDL